MRYISLSGEDFFRQINMEQKARDWLWRARFDGKDFVCPYCESELFYPIYNRPEVRKCKGCESQIRLRVGTILQDSKLPILKWVRALWFVMQGKRGISATELKRQLRRKTYGGQPGYYCKKSEKL
jgi:transposase-like protein